MGRKRKSGQRTKSGQLSRARSAVHDYGNERVRARIELFRVFRGDSAIGHEMSCAGRLMLVGAFDGLEYAPEVILSALLEYQNAYWGNYSGGASVSDYQKEVRYFGSVSGGIERDSVGQRFDRLDSILRDCGHQTRKAVIEVTVDRHWFPDEDAVWASRIVNTRIAEKRRAFVRSGKPVPDSLRISGELACDSDWAMLDLLRSGAMALTRGSMPEVCRAA
jgi:hypothetical protein